MTAANVNIDAIYPLTPVQQGILFHTLYAPDSPLYFQQYTCVLHGALDADVFRKSWQLVIDRHPALRSLFAWEGREQPLQIVRKTAEADWEEGDWAAADAAEQDRLLEGFLEADRRRGFVLDAAPLMRFAIFRTGEQTHRFVWSHHHIIVDGWSMGVVLDEVFRSYEALASGSQSDLAAPPPYRDYVRWLKAQDAAPAEAFWRGELSGFGAATSPRIGERPNGAGWAERHAEEVIHISAEGSAGAAGFARRHGLTINTIFRAAWALLLSRYSSSDDIVFGATVAGRPPELPGALDMVGLFINTVPVRLAVPTDQAVLDYLHVVQARQVAASAHETAALVDVQGWSDVPGGEPLFETLLVFENVPNPGSAASSLTTSDIRYLQRSNYPLAVLVMPGDEIEVIFLYDADRYEGAIIGRMARQLAHLVEALVAAPDTRLGDLQALPSAELVEVLHHWNATAAEYPIDGTAHQMMLEAAAAHPERVAVVGSGVVVTYRELAARAEIVARHLTRLGVGPDDRIGIDMPRSPGMVVAIFGVLMAGAAYVPIDSGLPPLRRSLLLEETAARAVITEPGTDSGDESLPAIHVDGAGAVTAAPEPASPATSLAASGPDDLAYVIFTSGSTGTPKGVAVSHRSLVNSTTARLGAYGEPVDTFLLLSPFIFDSSVAGLFSTLTQGGTLVLPGPRMEQDVAHLAELIATHDVTHTLALPTLYNLLLEWADPVLLRSLRLVMVAGEPCPPDLVRRHFAALPDTALVNEYGPTESTVWCTVHRLDPSPSPAGTLRVPIGTPIANTQVYLLDGSARPVPVGVPGEIHVGGVNLARGYLGRPELTAERFIEVDVPLVGPTRLYRTGDLARYLPDGSLDLLGRADHQVKLRGQRIELGEIEMVLRQHPGVRDAVVVLDHPAEPHRSAGALGAYVEGEADIDDLRGFVAQRLPQVMIPGLWVVVGALPRGATGKIDRGSLPAFGDAPSEAGSEFVAPHGPVEQQLAAIWESVLGIEPIGATDNFFELGGDSILSIRIIARAHQAGMTISPKQFFEHPTVAGLARLAVFPAAAAPEGR